MRKLRISLFGHLEISSGGQVAACPEGRKAQELLCLLLLSPARTLARAVVAETLFPDAAPTSSRKHLRQALWQAHLALDGRPEDRLVHADQERVWISPDVDVWTDAAHLEATVTAAEGTPAEDLDPSGLAELAHAVDLHRGPLLPGCYEDWCLVKREWFEGLFVTGADKLSVAYERRGDLERAIRWGRALLVAEPAHERTHRRLMRLYHLNDDRTRAIRQYARCRQVLEDELGVKPSRRTEAFAEAIRRDGAVPGGSPEQPEDAVVAEVAALREAVAQLQQTVARRLA